MTPRLRIAVYEDGQLVEYVGKRAKLETVKEAETLAERYRKVFFGDGRSPRACEVKVVSENSL